ncbi:MAG: Z-ring formation inhibitor MciZ [Dorea formicigenerans]
MAGSAQELKKRIKTYCKQYSYIKIFFRDLFLIVHHC